MFLAESLLGCSSVTAYETTRQVGSHIRLQSNRRDHPHSITIPDHDSLRVGTLNGILSDIADYVGVDRKQFLRDLFEK